MLILLIAKKRFGFGFWIWFNYSRIVNYSELPIPRLEAAARTSAGKKGEQKDK